MDNCLEVNFIVSEPCIVINIREKDQHLHYPRPSIIRIVSATRLVIRPTVKYLKLLVQTSCLCEITCSKHVEDKLSEKNYLKKVHLVGLSHVCLEVLTKTTNTLRKIVGVPIEIPNGLFPNGHDTFEGLSQTAR